MKTLTINTNSYANELSKYFEQINEVEKGNTNSVEFYRLPLKNLDTVEFSKMLENIILNKNPIIQSSTKLFFVIKEIVFAKDHFYIIKNLENYFLYNDTLNVDGYINFTLYEYSIKIDYILYSIVKRNLKRDEG